MYDSIALFDSFDKEIKMKLLKALVAAFVLVTSSAQSATALANTDGTWMTKFELPSGTAASSYPLLEQHLYPRVVNPTQLRGIKHEFGKGVVVDSLLGDLSAIYITEQPTGERGLGDQPVAKVAVITAADLASWKVSKDHLRKLAQISIEALFIGVQVVPTDTIKMDRRVRGEYELMFPAYVREVAMAQSPTRFGQRFSGSLVANELLGDMLAVTYASGGLEGLDTFYVIVPTAMTFFALPKNEENHKALASLGAELFSLREKDGGISPRVYEVYSRHKGHVPNKRGGGKST